MKKTISIFILSALFIMALTDFSGSSAQDPLESALLISAMSIAVKDGEYDISFIYIDYSADKNTENEYRFLNTSSPTIGGCIESAQRNSRTKIYFGQMDAVFLEKELFYDKARYDQIIDYLERDPYIGYSIYIYGIDSGTDEFNEKIADKDEKIISFLDEIIIKEPVKGSTDTHLLDIVSMYKCYIVPMISPDSENIISGLLAISDDGNIAEFSEDIFRPYGILQGHDGEYFYETPLGEFYTDKVNTSLAYDGEMHFTVFISCEFSSLGLKEYNSLQGKMIDVITLSFSEAVRDDCRSLIRLMQENSSDLLGANLYMHRFHYKEHGYLMQSGINIMRDCEFDVVVKSEFKGNGVMY